LPEALARSRNDSILVGAASREARPSGRRLARGVLRRLLTRPATTIAGAAFAAVLVGILVNALALQRERIHLPSLPAARAPVAEAPRAAPAPAPAADASAQPVTPPARPADLGAAADIAPPPAPPAARGDAIHDFLKGDAHDPDARRLTLAAQNALIKLGYSVKADGVAGASTQQSIRDFARAHGIASTEITPKLVRQLTAAAASR
jgi:hypothetical protein